MALWGGRFESGPDALFKALNDSLRFDYRLAEQDITGSIGWAKAISKAGVLTPQELELLTLALHTLQTEVRMNPSLPAQDKDEDIHSWVERKLIERVGPLGKKLHTGRSRNDQVITDLRLWTRAAIDDRLAEIKVARRSLLDLADRELSPTPTILPGYTHLQRAQPVLFAHWCLAYSEMLERDSARLMDARRRTNICPLGSGALAGTAYKINREQLAKDLGFDAPSANSLDAVSDRDFVLEILAAASICSVHLSRLGEDLILYGTQEFAFVEFDDTVSSGSSLMPQKKNPDSAELLRGKAGRVIGPLIALLTTVKGLPLAYNKDLQEDKEPLFLAMHHLSLCLQVVPRILDTLKVNRAACEKAAKGGHSNATDLADYLVGKGVPFREAHEQVGHAVRLAISAGVSLEDLPLDQLQAACPKVEKDVTASLKHSPPACHVEKSKAARGPEQVKKALAAARSRL